MFSIEKEFISPEECAECLKTNQAGAQVTFQGLVRDTNAGKKVKSLEYEVFEELALVEGKKILAEAIEKFKLLGAKAYHRHGHLNLGDLAVWVGVVSAHRKESFAACRFIIDELKARLPIWKKEYYLDGTSTWVNCQGCASTSFSPKEYYCRQASLLPGQSLLSQARVLVVGAGGLGSSALSYLAGAGIGSIEICDSDRLELSNLHRQVLYSHDDIGKFKAELARDRLSQINPFIKISANKERVSVENIMELVGRNDLVLDCSDNFETKFLINDACFLLKKPYVSASVYLHEGRLHSYSPDGEYGCSRCLWPETPEENSVGSCAEVGVLGATVGVFGSMQAMEVIKYFSNSADFGGATVIYDLLQQQMDKIKFPKDPDCPLCGTKKIPNIVQDNYSEAYFIEFLDLDLENDRLIDIREEDEWDESGCNAYLDKRPMSAFESVDLDKSQRTVLVCQRGIRSSELTKKLRNEGFERVFSLKRGIASLAEGYLA